MHELEQGRSCPSHGCSARPSAHENCPNRTLLNCVTFDCGECELLNQSGEQLMQMHFIDSSQFPEVIVSCAYRNYHMTVHHVAGFGLAVSFFTGKRLDRVAKAGEL